jgi:hypothetical protein
VSQTVEFGSKADADAAREEWAEWVCPVDDDRRMAQVAVVSDTPDDVLASIRAVAEESRADETGGVDLAGPLAEDTRDAIKEVDGFDSDTATTLNWRKAKAIYSREGHPEWFAEDISVLADYDDPAEGAVQQINRRREGIGGIEQGATGAVGGARNEGEREERNRRRQQQAAQRQQAGECGDTPEKWCERGDEDACEHLQEVCDYSEEEIERIMGAAETPDDTEETVTVGSGESAMEVRPETANALQQSWQGYKGGISAARDALEEFAEEWENAQAAARAINEIRAEHGQDRMHFESLEEIQGALAADVAEMARDCEECHLGPEHSRTLADVGGEAPEQADVERRGPGEIEPVDPQDRRLAAQARARRSERLDAEMRHPEEDLAGAERYGVDQRRAAGTGWSAGDEGGRIDAGTGPHHRDDRDRPDRREKDRERLRRLGEGAVDPTRTVTVSENEAHHLANAARWSEKNGEENRDRRARLREIRGRFARWEGGPVPLSPAEADLLGDAVADYSIDGVGTPEPDALTTAANKVIDHADRADPATDPIDADGPAPIAGDRLAGDAGDPIDPRERIKRVGGASDGPAWDVETIRDLALGDEDAARAAVTSWDSWGDFAAFLDGYLERGLPLNRIGASAPMLGGTAARHLSTWMSPTTARRVLLTAGMEDAADRHIDPDPDEGQGTLADAAARSKAERAEGVEVDPQRTIEGDRADAQTRFEGGERGDVGTEHEQPTETNPGGLEADRRETTRSTDDLETATVDAFQVAEGGQETLGGGDE